MLPSIWISPVEVRVPRTVRSELMIEGAMPRDGRLGRGGAAGLPRLRGAGAGTGSLGLLENMSACLDEVAGIAHDVVEPDFVMDMRTGAAPGGTNASNFRAPGHLHAGAHQDRGQMPITCVDAI